MSLFHLYFLGYQPLTPWILYTVHLTYGIIITLFLYPFSKKGFNRYRPSIIDQTAILATVVCAIYFISQMDTIIYRIGITPTKWDLICDTIFLILVLEITRRTNGIVLPLIAITFILYVNLGDLFPGILGHRGYEWDRIISYLVGLDALYSVPLGASASFVFLFILFSAFLNYSGAGKFFINFALSLTGSRRGGPAKRAVVASSLFGMVSGNSAANVMSTGTFTIPLMKSIGYSSKFAAAVEAVSSTGGQMTPPILGAAAFIIAQLVGVPYMRIVSASLIPAILYYTAVFYIIDLEARKVGLSGIPKESLQAVGDVVKRTGHLIIPIFVLIYVLVIMKASPIKAAIWAIYATFLVTFLRKETRMSFKSLIQALIKGPESAVGMISARATAGIVIGVLNLTGAGLKIAGAIIDISGGILPIALVLTMIASIILGMGLPTTAAYLICAAVITPALVKIGVAPLTAHMFVFYFACISAITPPVALAAFAGAGIAQAKPIPVALTAMKLGIIAFVIPCFFVYGPSLLLDGSVPQILVTLITSLLGIYALGGALQGYFRSSSIGIPERTTLFICSILLIKPGVKSDAIGLIILIAIFLFDRWRNNRG